MTYNLTAPCHFGLEKTLSFELKRAGAENIAVSDGRINFTGDEHCIARANICCSVAERIGIVLADFDTKGDFDVVFEQAQNIPIEQYVGRNDKFPITKGHSLNSKLTSIPALQRTIKKGLVMRMQKAYKISGTVEETGEMFPITFLLMKDRMTIILDTSGEGLHKRGYRAMSNAAPIKETLAAGIIDLAHVRGTDLIVDPFCGSGTILIEAAFKALNMAPCLNRNFTAMSWDCINRTVWEDEFERARADIRKDSDFVAYGWDIDSSAVELTKSNAWKAGVEKHIVAERRAVKDFKYPDKPCKIICNPPYAERMMELSEAEQIYREMGKTMLPLGENQLYIITSNEKFEEIFGAKSSKNRKLYNGMLMCRLFSYLPDRK